MLLRFPETHIGRVCILLLLIAPLNHQSHAQNDQRQELEKLRQTILTLQKELEATKSNRDEIHQSIELSEKEIGDLSTKAKKIESTLKNRQNKLNKLNDQRSQLRKRKKQQKSLITNHIHAAYRLGQHDNLRLLLNQEDPSRVSRNLKYYGYVASSRAKKISEYSATISKIEALESEISYQRNLIKADYDSLKAKQSRLNSAQVSRRTMLAKLTSKIVSKDQKLKTLQENRRQLEKLLSKVIENIAEINVGENLEPFSTLKGKLPWPAKGRVIKEFGSQRVANKMRWEGILIRSNEGDPVRAVHYGRVVFSDYLRGHGLLIIVDHGSDFLSLYAHNQALYKTLGEWVESGDTIATVGNSGGQPRSALYFELRYKGKPTNPQLWFRLA